MNRLLDKLRTWYSGLQQREQRAVAAGGVLVAVMILLVGIVMPLHSAVSGAVLRNQTKREDLAWMRANAAEISAGNLTIPQSTGESPIVLVGRIGGESGLGPAMRGTQPNGTGVRVQLEDASFDTMVTWLASLEQHHGLSIESISVDRTVRPGVVNASVTFAQAPL